MKSVAVGKTSTIVAADDSLITWGPSPTWGELGYGKSGPKSSTKANKVDSLEGGGEFVKVAMGGSHSLVVFNPKDPKFLSKLPVLNQPELGGASAGGAAKKRKAGAAAAGKTKKKKKTGKKKGGAKAKAGTKKKTKGKKKPAGKKKITGKKKGAVKKQVKK